MDMGHIVAVVIYVIIHAKLVVIIMIGIARHVMMDMGYPYILPIVSHVLCFNVYYVIIVIATPVLHVDMDMGLLILMALAVGTVSHAPVIYATCAVPMPTTVLPVLMGMDPHPQGCISHVLMLIVLCVTMMPMYVHIVNKDMGY